MNRAFVSLYLIIVLSIVLLGLVLNKFWDEINPPVEIDPAVVDLIALIETSLKSSKTEDKNTYLKQATAGFKYQVKLLSLSNFSKTDIAEKIKQGGIISVNDEKIAKAKAASAAGPDQYLLAEKERLKNRALELDDRERKLRDEYKKRKSEENSQNLK